jgi:hypothetical protein
MTEANFVATVTWIKCGNDSHWCNFDTLDLASVGETIGVYIIWHAGNPGRVVRVGQGKIADRAAVHRNDIEVTKYRANGTLHITWASVPKASDRNGIERHLADTWKPLVGDAWPDVTPIAVNSPW